MIECIAWLDCPCVGWLCHVLCIREQNNGVTFWCIALHSLLKPTVRSVPCTDVLVTCVLLSNVFLCQNRFVQEAAEGSYDIIIVDSSDPVGPAEVLFQQVGVSSEALDDSS